MKVQRKHKHETFESMLRRFKKGCEKSDIINEVKKREHFEKSSTTRRKSREMAAKKAQLHHLLGGNNADAEYVARMQRAESVNQILSKILRDTISQHPEIAELVRDELAMAFELMENPDEDSAYIEAEVVEVNDAGN